MAFVYAGLYSDSAVGRNGEPLKSTPVDVFLPGSTTERAALFADREKTVPAANPVATDARGNLIFRADPGPYDVRCNGATVRIMVPEDPDEPTGAGPHGHAEADVVNLVADLAAKETPAGANAKVAAHSALNTGVHGVGASAVESTAGAQAKVDAHRDVAAPHAGHETPAGAQAKVDVEAAARAAGDATLIPLAQRGAANGVATLGADSKIPTTQIPAIAISDYLGAVASQAAILALVGQRGDWATRTDLAATFILAGDDSTILANWVALPTPADAVLSVDGATGAVVLASDGPPGTATKRTLGAGATQAAPGNDARLSDARTPTAHKATHEPGGTDALAVDAAANVGSLRTLGAGANQAAAGADLDAHLVDTIDAHDASAVSFVPAGTVAATNVQAAIEEVAAEAGGVTDGDKGDITVSGGGTVWAVDNNAVTLAQLADIASARLLGRVTAAVGDPEELTAAQVRTLLALVVGTDVQAYDADLAAIAALATTPFGRSLLELADAAALGNAHAHSGTYVPLALLTAQGDIAYATAASTWARLAKGTAGQALRMNAGATAPEWTASEGIPQRSRPVHGATRTNSALGSLSTAWTDTVEVVAGQVVEYRLQVTGTRSADGTWGIALARNGTIVDRRLVAVSNGTMTHSGALVGWDEPGAGTHTYEVYASAPTGTFTIDSTVDTATTWNAGLTNDGISSLILQAVAA